MLETCTNCDDASANTVIMEENNQQKLDIYVHVHL